MAFQPKERLTGRFEVLGLLQSFRPVGWQRFLFYPDAAVSPNSDIWGFANKFFRQRCGGLGRSEFPFSLFPGEAVQANSHWLRGR